MECPECQRQNPEDAKFCNGCGCHLVEDLDTEKTIPSIESERKHVTITFSDLTGYTSMTECLDPEEVKGIMSQIFGKITDIVKIDYKCRFGTKQAIAKDLRPGPTLGGQLKKIIGIVPLSLYPVISRSVVKAGEDELAGVIENELMTLLERQNKWRSPGKMHYSPYHELTQFACFYLTFWVIMV